MLKEKLQKASKKALHIVERTPAASAMMAVVMGAVALSSCTYDVETYEDSAGRVFKRTRKGVHINSVGGGNGNGWFDINGGGGGCWGGIPMYSGNYRGYRIPGLNPGEGFYRRPDGLGVITPPPEAPMLSVNAKDLITKQDADGNEWQMTKGTKLPKAFKVIIAEDKTIPVPAAQYDQITAAMNKGELKFVVDANGQYGLVPTAAVKEFETATLTFEQIAKQAAAQKTQAKGKGSR